MIRKLFIVFAFALITQLISGCVDCNCGLVRTIPYTKKGLTLNILDASLPEPMIAKDSVIATSKFGLRMQVLTEDLALLKPAIKLGLMATANACSCPENDFIAQEDIASIQIFSNNDFDINHPKNKDLSLYFKVKTYNSLIAITDYIKQLKNVRQGS